MRKPFHGVTPLAGCAPGVRATVVAVSCEPRFRLRLAEMGFTHGAPVCVVRSAPLGDPLEVEVRGYRLCLRRAEAAEILVEVEGQAPEACCGRQRGRRERGHGRCAPHCPGGEP